MLVSSIFEQPWWMIVLRAYLLAGLFAHKLLWELLKRRGGAGSAAQAPPAPGARAVKTVKVAILLGIVAQVFVPDVLPMTDSDATWRAVGALLFTAGLAVAVLGRLQLGTNWADIESAAILDRQRVVDRGLYHYIRHPIYVGDLLLLFGLELALNSWLVAAVALLTPIVLRQAIREERMLLQKLPGYEDYCRRSRRFVPWIV